MSTETVQMVQVTCDRCGRQPTVMTETEAEQWQQKHDEFHAAQDRRERMRLLGHECRVVDSWMDVDDSGGRVVCTCNFKSRESKLCWMDDYIDRHLEEVEVGLLKAWAQAA